MDLKDLQLKLKEIRDDSGWGAWSVYNSGKYLNYL